jgi:hypothetical protein
VKEKEFTPNIEKHKVTKFAYRAILSTFLLASFTVFEVSAQGPCDPFDPQPGCEDYNPDDVPIDGGASVLIAAGVAYGLKKAYDKRKQNKEEDIV